MVSFFRIKSLRDEELIGAIELMEKEYPKELRNTPEKMAGLITSNFDVACDPSRIAKFLGLPCNEDLESESLKIEYYGNE